MGKIFKTRKDVKIFAVFAAVLLFGMFLISSAKSFEKEWYNIDYEDYIKNTEFYSVSEEVLDVLSSVYRQVSSLMNQPDNPYREEIIRHLFSAHYYGLGYYMHGLQSQPVALTAQQEKCERFMSLVAENFKTQRDIGFYADKLCVTGKYLSTMLKHETGMTALDWIERYVVLYAKSCLSSTSMTIQEISDELDFPSQSVFGKYFKRVEGMSPKAYRHSTFPLQLQSS